MSDQLLRTSVEGSGTRSLRQASKLRSVYLVLGGVCLLAGLNGGLLLLDLPAPVSFERLAEAHGELLVFGFLGTVIALERSVALRRGWSYLAPAGFAVGSLALLSAMAPMGRALQLLGCSTLLFSYVALWQRTREAAVAIQGLGATLALGALLTLSGGASLAITLPWLVGFLTLTIAGERLELMRLQAAAGRLNVFGPLAAGALATAAIPALLWPLWGIPVFGAILIACTLGLLRFDIARTTVRLNGLPRFSATCILTGYVWLLVSAATWLLAGPQLRGPRYDLVIHAVFLGFALSMIMGHAPIIIPAVTQRAVQYRTWMWGPFLLLQAGLLVRIALGDIRQYQWAWQLGGALNVLAVLAFLLSTLLAVDTKPGKDPR